MITFGITNSSKYDSNSHLYIEKLIKSIEDESIPGVEIICCGDYKNSKYKCIEIDETDNPISLKINTITDNAQYEKICYIRDYFILWPNWYKGLLKFEEMYGDWDLLMNVILQDNGLRYRDWCSFCDPSSAPGKFWIQNESWTPPEGIKYEGQAYIANYSYHNPKFQYISGAYWLGKKAFMKKYPLNNETKLFSGEDVEWYNKFRYENFIYKMNRYSVVQLQKHKDTCLPFEHEYFGSNEYATKDYISKDLL